MATQANTGARAGCAAVALLVVLAGCARNQPAPPPPIQYASQTTSVAVSSPTPSASPVASPSPSPSPTPTQPAVNLPDPAKLNESLAKVPSKNVGTTSLVVMDSTGQTIVSRSDQPLTPASVMKVVTAAAVLDKIDQNVTFKTRVVRVDASTIALVGGGDPLLTDAPSKDPAELACLTDLAKKTAAALGGATTVKLVYDESLFSGPNWGGSWREEWKGHFPVVGALVINGAMKDGWNSHPDPANQAAQAFAKRLQENGITVSSTAAGLAPETGRTLASVASAPLGVIVADMMRTSNNLSAEVLARHLGLATYADGSFDGGSKAIQDWLTARGWLDSGVVIDGGSGLSLKALLTGKLVSRVLGLTLTDPRYASVVSGLPVAGVSGTLKNRFNNPATAAGRGNVHAKTGTLDNVATLAGFVKDQTGVYLVFSAMANQTGGHVAEATSWLDTSASVLAGCGCR